MNKPVPQISDINLLYFEGAAAGELRVRKCHRCGARFRFAHAWCPKCWSSEIGYERASGRGTVTNFCVVYQAPYAAFEEDVPYIIALIELDEGVRIMSNVIRCAPDHVRVGLAVKVVFEQRGEVTLPMFEPAD